MQTNSSRRSAVGDWRWTIGCRKPRDTDRLSRDLTRFYPMLPAPLAKPLAKPPANPLKSSRGFPGVSGGIQAFLRVLKPKKLPSRITHHVSRIGHYGTLAS